MIKSPNRWHDVEMQRKAWHKVILLLFVATFITVCVIVGGILLLGR